MLGGGAPRIENLSARPDDPSPVGPQLICKPRLCGDCDRREEFAGERGGETGKSFSGDGGGDRGDTEVFFVLGGALSCTSGEVQESPRAVLSSPRGTDDDFALGCPEEGFDFGRLRLVGFDLFDLALSVLEDRADVCAFPGLIRLDCQL